MPRCGARSCLGLRLDQNILVNNGLPQWQVGSVAKTGGKWVEQFPGTRGGKEALLCSVVFLGNGQM